MLHLVSGNTHPPDICWSARRQMSPSFSFQTVKSSSWGARELPCTWSKASLYLLFCYYLQAQYAIKHIYCLQDSCHQKLVMSASKVKTDKKAYMNSCVSLNVEERCEHIVLIPKNLFILFLESIQIGILKWITIIYQILFLMFNCPTLRKFIVLQTALRKKQYSRERSFSQDFVYWK